MRKTTIPTDIDNQRYLRKQQAKIYYQVGDRSLLTLAQRANALRKVGRIVLIDKKTLDEYLEAQVSK